MYLEYLNNTSSIKSVIYEQHKLIANLEVKKRFDYQIKLKIIVCKYTKNVIHDIFLQLLGLNGMTFL